MPATRSTAVDTFDERDEDGIARRMRLVLRDVELRGRRARS